MKNYNKTTYQMMVLGMLISLEEREKHHSLVGDVDIAKMYREQRKEVQRSGKLGKELRDRSWTADMFAKVYGVMRLHPDDYQEVFDMFFSL
jgi:hypothetical protein